MTKKRFRSIWAVLRWRKQHPRRRIRGVVVESNPPLHKPQKHHPIDKSAQIIAYCHTALRYAGRMTYSQSSLRSQLFHRKPGDFAGAHADCSQLVASILHWCGNTKVSASDYTGTLLQKGKLVGSPAPGRVVIFGGGTGEHAAFITERFRGDWYVVGFGHQGAPDRVLLSALKLYFIERGHPGVRYLEFF